MSIKQIVKLLEECGEMTSVELAEAIGVRTERITAIMSKINKERKLRPKLVYVVRYSYDHPGTRTYPRKVYALGDKPDAKKPKIDNKARHRQYWHNRMAKTVASVFDLGIPVNERIKGKRWNSEKDDAPSVEAPAI